MQKIANFLKRLRIKGVELLPYHALGEHKWDGVNMERTRYSIPKEAEMKKFYYFFK